MSIPTQIVDTLIEQLTLNTGCAVIDGHPQIDQYTQLPCLHLRELAEPAPERRGTDLKRQRTLQLDIYQSYDDARAARDELLGKVLRYLIPQTGVGRLMPGSTLLDIQIKSTMLEPDAADMVSEFRVTSVVFVITFTS